MEKLYMLVSQISPQGVNLPNEVNPDGNAGFLTERLQRTLQLSLGILGAIAVLMIVIAALQYVLSAGDTQKVAKAKDAIIYAVIGLVVAILAFSIVTFVLDGLFQ